MGCQLAAYGIDGLVVVRDCNFRFALGTRRSRAESLKSAMPRLKQISDTTVNAGKIATRLILVVLNHGKLN
jgi:hypothetical protein